MTAAPDSYLSVICLPDDVATFEHFKSRAAAAGMSEYRSAPMVFHEWSRPAPIAVPYPPPAPWWHGVTAGQRVRVVRDGVAVQLQDGRPALAKGKPFTVGPGSDVSAYRTPTAVDILRGVVMVFGDSANWPGGLYVRGDDLVDWPE